jgi:hypothetical protein
MPHQGIFPIFFCHIELKNIPCLVMEYYAMSHTLFVGGINNDLLALNILSLLV